ncbi:thermonuclease family protein [Caenimonas aquaedulcis]|uniref:Thermonuclease family protein n=1 Tax=Caenimonas aquaedulcis TaxID=2793270 RepID=A0A931H6C1_9BURK|nr:thermonuclease family protein [Caenimonas aquaedulcis]MBG9389277.1 thermonuclease family protein [Caenimonas aquaedulcis]
MFARALLTALALFGLISGAQARSLTGVVTHVTDGDTIWVRPVGADSAVAVRLQGLDAPEICQAFGVQARDALAAHVLHQRVSVSVKARDVYHRTVGRVALQGDDLGAWLVVRGYAWSSHYRRRAGPYAQQEAQARGARRGLWASPATDPKAFRKRHGSCR